mgnify:CR=1 FL=1
MIRFRKALFPIGLLLGAIAIAGWLRATKPSSPANPITEHIWTVDVLPVVVADIQPEMRLFAQIVAGREVELRALDRYGEPMQLTAHGLAARVIQHETDHLNGVLFLDRMQSFDSLTHLNEFSRFWNTERD